MCLGAEQRGQRPWGHAAQALSCLLRRLQALTQPPLKARTVDEMIIASRNPDTSQSSSVSGTNLQLVFQPGHLLPGGLGLKSE